MSGVDDHEHDIACSFGHPQCPLFGQPEPIREPWWRRLIRRSKKAAREGDQSAVLR